MSKNVLFIVVDSVTNDILFNKSTSLQVAPFLNKLRKKSISGDNMYSEAPFTEAALKCLLSSVDTMDNNGYMERLRDSKCVWEVFQNNGYETLFTNYYPSICPSYIVKGIDQKRYLEGYQFSHIWVYRLEYFSKIYAEGKITDKEIDMLIDMLEDNFIAWIDFLNKMINDDIEVNVINECTDKTGIEDNLKEVKNEYKKFKKDKVKYLKEIFELKEKHKLNNIKEYGMTDKVHDDEVRYKVMNDYKYIFNKIKKLNFKRNLVNNKFPFKKMIKKTISGDLRTVKGLLAGYKNSLIDKDLYERINDKYDMFKGQRSFNTVSEELFKMLNKNKDKKWAAYVHIDDAHYTEDFFTYDTNNINLIDSEFKKVNKFLDNLPKDYEGSITYDLALMYVDGVIKKIFDFLEKENLLENTSVVITADHGYSFNFSPVREKYVISNYHENYNAPFIVYDNNIKPKMIEKFCTTKDIPATLLDLADINIPNEFKGKSLLKTKGQDYVTIEYMGSGCPDIDRRPINLGVRTKEYLVTADLYINKNFEEQKLKEIYDLNKDPNENDNLINKKNIYIKSKKEINLLKNRFEEIKKQYNK